MRDRCIQLFFNYIKENMSNLYIATYKIEVYEGSKCKILPKEHTRIIWAEDEDSARDKLEISVLGYSCSRSGGFSEQITDLEITQAII
jgi:hypothetical protein